MGNILALDLGTTMGWAMRQDGRVSSGSVSFSLRRPDSANSRYSRFRRWLDGNHCATFDDVVYEAVMRHNGTIAAHTYGGFMATLQMWCDARGLACEGIPVGTIKKFATGRGNATKQGMVAAMRERGHRPKDHNEADALALLFWRLEQTRPGQARLEQTSLEAANTNVPSGRR